MSLNPAWYDEAAESLDDLIIGDLKYIQARSGYRFSVDSILLAHFPLVNGLKRAVDLGAGNGLLALLLSWRQPGLQIAAVELQESMADRARRNVLLNHREDQITVLRADVSAIRKHLPAGGFELAVCNPPFFPAGSGHPSRNLEERLARHESSAALNDFVAAARYLLADRGRLAVVMPAPRLQEALHTFAQNQLALSRLRSVHSREGENAVLVLLEVVKGGSRPAQILPPLLIYAEDGSYAPEIMTIYGGAD